ncbi:family 61 putative glycoside hydrolase, partial [Cladorrhinum samala]
MRLQTLLSLGLASTFASAHTVLTTIFIDGQNQGDGTCIRMGVDPERVTFPISSIDSPDMACGFNGDTPVAFTCPAKAGSTITMAFRAWADDSSRGPIDISHVGSISVYLKHLSSPSSSASGSGWFKIYHSGYSQSAKAWSAETLIKNNGLLTTDLPSSLPSGDYLLRTEVLALQNYPETQFFVNCAQLRIASGTAATAASIPSDKTVSIPGHVKADDKGLTYNIFEIDPVASPYPIPGPKPYFPTTTTTAAGTNTKATDSSSGSQLSQDGLVPKTCILKNANWCAAEIPDFSGEDECWASSDNCWKQVEACYNSAPPSGGKGCKLWSDKKCEVTQRRCAEGDWNGPQDKGAIVASWDEASEPIPGGQLPPVDVGEDRVE